MSIYLRGYMYLVLEPHVALDIDVLAIVTSLALEGLLRCDVVVGETRHGLRIIRPTVGASKQTDRRYSSAASIKGQKRRITD